MLHAMNMHWVIVISQINNEFIFMCHTRRPMPGHPNTYWCSYVMHEQNQSSLLLSQVETVRALSHTLMKARLHEGLYYKYMCTLLLKQSFRYGS